MKQGTFLVSISLLPILVPRKILNKTEFEINDYKSTPFGSKLQMLLLIKVDVQLAQKV